MKQLKLSFLLLFLGSSGLFAQSTLNAAGGGGMIGTNTYDYSIGEMTLVSTFSSASVVVTQGLLQPEAEWAVSTKDLIIRADQLNIFPNPTQSIVNIQPNFNTAGNMQVQLLDMNGRVLLTKQIKLANGTEKQQFDLSAYAQGSYFLNVQFNNSKNSYKIQKIK